MMLKLYLHIFLSIFSFTCSLPLYFPEGQDAEIIFQYNGFCENNSFALSIENRLPFYHAGKISLLGLYPNQHARFQVRLKEWKNQENNSFCYISVVIGSLQREDAGTYIFQSNHKDDNNSNGYLPSVRVYVIFPPGKAVCNVNTPPEDTGSYWLVLHCTAEAGMYHGKFECYQNGKLVPPWTKPTQQGHTLKQSLLIQKVYPVLCCSTVYYKHKSLCECHDYKWDPKLGNVTQDAIDPCTVTTTSTNTNIISTRKQNLSATITTTEKESVTGCVISEENNTTDIPRINIIYKKYIWQTFIITFACCMVLVALSIVIWKCAHTPK